jgi:hypothetical protein
MVEAIAAYRFAEGVASETEAIRRLLQIGLLAHKTRRFEVTQGPKGGITAVVYSPPRPDLPHLAVSFGPDGEVIAARTMPSLAAAEAFIEDIMTQFAKERGAKAIRR